MNDALDILNALASAGVSVWAEGSRIRFRAANGALPAELKERLGAQKSAVIAAWRERAAAEISSHLTTYSQRALWFINQEAPNSPAYNIAIPLRIHSSVDVPALKNAFQALVDRHPSLRTTYAMDRGSLMQKVHGHMPVSFRTHDRAGTDLQTLRDELIESSHVPFGLEAGPIMRVDLFTRAAADHVLVVAVHHIAVDGWSGLLLMEDLRLNYLAETGEGGTPPPRPGSDVPAFARWQAEMLSSAEGLAHENYWMQALAGELPVLELPTDRPRLAANTVCGASLPLDLGAEASAEVRTLAMACGTTPFVVLLAAYHALLHRLTGSEQTISGSPTYGRDHAEWAEVIGDFVNTIPLKADFSGDPTFRELLAQLRNRVLKGLDHQDYPFGLLVEKLHPVRHPARTPIFQTLFILQRYKHVSGLQDLYSARAGESRIDFGGLLAEAFQVPQFEGQFDLALELTELGGSYQGHLKYNADLFSVATVTALAGHYSQLLRALIDSPNVRISRAPILSPPEEHQILHEWNDTTRDYPRNLCLHELITAQVDRTPDAIAVTFEDQQLTYRELDARANQLARYLQKRGVKAETRVGVCLERSLEMVVGLLGILKAGGAYVPMDPSYPKKRLAFMLEDAGAGILLAQKHLEPILGAANTGIVWLDSDWIEIARESTDRPENCVKAENLAYMIYTSGSTGRPKGAMIEHRSAVNEMLWIQDQYHLTAADAMLQKTPCSFDVSVWEFFLPLMAGARLVMARPEGHKDPVYLIDVVCRESITIIQFVPSMLRVFLAAEGVDRCTTLRDVICIGEALPPDLVDRFHSLSSAALHNLYGPAEATLSVTWWTCPRNDVTSVVPIGRPEANTRCYVLDRYMQPVPVGVPGELHIGGIQVGRGYHNRPELTAEKFIPDPFSKESEDRLYKTGDLCRLLRDGNIEYLGRMDQQVKIRGSRIELGEIEAALMMHPDVCEAAIAVREDTPGDLQLVAYFVPTDGANPSGRSLRAALRSSLPDHMVPWAFVQIDRLPLGPSGKLDRKALAASPKQPSCEMDEYVPPRNKIERTIAEIWADVLRVESVGVFQHFFELGGHSLSATQMVASLKTAFQTEIPLRCVFSAPTVAELANHIVYDGQNQTYKYSAEVHQWKRLVLGQPKGSRIPFYLVAGFADGDDTLRVLSTVFPHFGLDQPVFGFQPRWLDGHSRPYSSVEEVAREFVEELRAFQPEGPYFLGGECIGGIVALEMAREILRQGAEVGLLVMYDTQRPTPCRAFLAGHEAVMKRAGHIIHLISGIITGKSGSRLEIIRNLVHRKLHKPRQGTRPEPQPDRFYAARTAFQRLVFEHSVKPYPGRITLIVNEQQPKFDKDLGWRGWASGGLEILTTPGDHWSRYFEDSEAYSKLLRKCLERSQAEFVQAGNDRDVNADVQRNSSGETAPSFSYGGAQR